jgi:heat shock protein HslJ
VTDDIRADSRAPVDLLIVGGLTIDVLDGEEVVGGAARYATEAALAAGLRVGLHTVSGPEPAAREAVERLGRQAEVAWHEAATSIVFEHHGAHDERRLRRRSGTDSIRIPDPDRLPPSRAVLFAPVAGEVTIEAIQATRTPLRAAGLQGWLRQTDAGGWVSRLRLSAVDAALADVLRGLDILLASVDELGGESGPDAVGRLRAWTGALPEVVVTAGASGAWIDAGGGPPRHVPAEVVDDRHTIGAGDAFAAVLTAQRGAGLDLHAAAVAATRATARYLSERQPTTILDMDAAGDLAELDGTTWRPARFGPGLEHTPPPDAEFSLEIQGDRIAGRSGCNRYMGTWAVDDGRLRIGPLASTMMFCDGLMELEDAYLAALQSAERFTSDADRLAFIGHDGEVVAEFSPGA